MTKAVLILSTLCLCCLGATATAVAAASAPVIETSFDRANAINGRPQPLGQERLVEPLRRKHGITRICAEPHEKCARSRELHPLLHDFSPRTHDFGPNLNDFIDEGVNV
ncbi:hypothetical protein [Massilia cavernae]|uniref:hypothetical protein n=1 Tax=Massilia cavernae TaxID=2320864 RepID=UPI0011C433CD|nr:hypothetical protein [Massilia cavernae]